VVKARVQSVELDPGVLVEGLAGVHITAGEILGKKRVKPRPIMSVDYPRSSVSTSRAFLTHTVGGTTDTLEAS
jgi:hypothetical protein